MIVGGKPVVTIDGVVMKSGGWGPGYQAGEWWYNAGGLDQRLGQVGS
jgi:hypothetical protein